MTAQPQPAWVRPYLEHLGLGLETPSYDYLARLTRAHLSTCAFENLTKFYYFRRQPETGWFIPPVDTFVENLRLLDAGGTCYSLNSSFKQLLDQLGFDAYFVDFPEPGHVGLVVTFGSARHYVDVGVNGPIFEPMNMAEYSKAEWCGRGIHVYSNDAEQNHYKLDQYVDGERKLTWDFRATEPVSFASFTSAIAKSNVPRSFFMSGLTCSLYQPRQRRTVTLRDTTFIIRSPDGTKVEHQLGSVAEIEAVLRDEFGKPHLPVREAVTTLESFGIDVFAEKE